MTWTRTMRCKCRKKKHRTERDAIAQAAADREQYDAVVTVYRCPGSLAWHVTARGFVPASLGSYGRRLAYELVLHPGGVFLDDFTGRVLRIGQDSSGYRTLRRYARQMVDLDVARWRPATDGGRPTGWIELTDETAARRVVQIGVDGYLEEAATCRS